METVEKEIIPNFVVVAFDETEYWAKEIQDDCEKIEGVYLIDLNRVTYCASITPSYWAVFLYNQFHLNDGIDIEEWEHNAHGQLENENEDMYVNCSNLNIVHTPEPLTESEWEKFKEDYDDREEAYSAYEESQRDNYNCNQPY